MNGYIRKYLDIPISGTLSNVFLERKKFGLNICPPSIKCTQCQTVLRNSLKESPNDSLKDLRKSSSCHTDIQYDVYKCTRKFLKISVLIKRINNFCRFLLLKCYRVVILSLIYPRTFAILPSATSTTPSLHVRI